ncbi:multicopper oxidase domain-containing protein [bacterium]|nr:multicopper oxidase domain-containing protein [bacterium]
MKRSINSSLLFRSFFPLRFVVVGILSCLLVLGFNSKAANALTIPTALTGTTFDLTMAYGTTQFFDTGNATTTGGYNGSMLGPTLIMNSGDFVTLNVQNSLGEETTTHWHGMHVNSSDDGGPHTVIAAGDTWSPDFTVYDTCATFWYHPHLHEQTHEQVNAGLAGMILIRDDVETAAGLPTSYGEDEFPLIIQDKEFDGSNQLRRVNFGNVIMVNGTLDPTLEVPAQYVRFRVLNGSSERAYHLGFSDNRNFYIVGADGGLLEAPVELNRAVMMPAERLDIVLDLGSSQGSTINLVNYATTLPMGLPGSPTGPGGMNALNMADTAMLEIVVGAATASPVTSIASSIWTIPDRPLETEATVTRSIQLTRTGMTFGIDGQSYDSSRMDQVVLKDAVEIWEITSMVGAHPFHIHDIQFFILDRDGNPPEAREAGKKDTVLVNNETVRFIAKFERFTDTEIPYMYHCHILPHEDAGMMAQFIVVDPEEQLIDLTPSSTDITLRWSKNLGTDVFTLQTSSTVDAAFSAVGTTPTVVDDKNQITYTVDTANRFFRLAPVTTESGD